jgi:Fic family protein
MTALQEVASQPDILRELTRRIEDEYAEMPGLSLTLPQAQRLWAIDRQTCERALSTLVSRRILRRTARDRFVRV